MSFDFNKLLNENSNRTANPTETLEMQLRGRDRADYSKSEYTETPITQEQGALVEDIREGIAGIDLGQFLDFNELALNEQFDKLVLLKSYSTATNKFDTSKSDLIFDFIDRNGLPIRSRSFGALDTSNQVTLDNKLTKLKGNAVWLRGKLVTSNGRNYIDVLHVSECEVLQGNTNQVNQFFQKEVKGREDFVSNIRTQLANLPMSTALFEAHSDELTTSAIPGIVERKGGYIKYLAQLITTVKGFDLPEERVDTLLSIDIVTQLKTITEDNLELALSIKQSLNGKVSLSKAKEVLNESLFNKYEGQDVSVYQEVLEGLRQGIYGLIQLEYWSKYNMEMVFSPYTKRNINLRRD